MNSPTKRELEATQRTIARLADQLRRVRMNDPNLARRLSDKWEEIQQCISDSDRRGDAT